MEIIDICREIFNGKELTVTPVQRTTSYGLTFSTAVCTLNKWHPKRKPVNIDVELFKILSDLNILQLDSGNFETGEEHYVFNQDSSLYFAGNSGIHLSSVLRLLKPILREVRINRLLV